MNVKNKSCIRNISLKQFKAAGTRNIIAIFAIALTTLLFTSLFTIILSINEGFQQSNFRQCGGYSHGVFKYLSEERFDEIKDDPLIKEWGYRRFIGMPDKIPFNKAHVEVSYSDANEARWMYCEPVQGGRLPEENTREAATDTRVLDLLGVEAKIGNEFTMTFNVDGRETTQTFTLCGWWEYDDAIVASHVLIPLSRAEAILEETGVVPGETKDGMTGSWNLDVMFANSLDIGSSIEKVLENHGFQDKTPSDADTYIPTGINWGYSTSQLIENMDPATAAAIAAMLILIIFTGYLIIYNVFRISVANDIRFYGLLKTIGTTPLQLRTIVLRQALMLCIAGIPLGLLAGWLAGGVLTPVIISQLNAVVETVSSGTVIFIASTIFSLLTVLISCRKPAKLASRVSPIEAVRYTEGQNIRKKVKKSASTVSLLSMARANLGRNKIKTAVTIISLSLAVVLLNFTVTFTNGFDMDKYISNNVVSDFVIADASYFQTAGIFSADSALPQSTIDEINSENSVTEGGRVYGSAKSASEFVTEDYYRFLMRNFDSDALEQRIKTAQRNEDGLIEADAQLYGMENFALDKLKTFEGDISMLKEPGKNYIAAVYSEDDYGKIVEDSNWAKLGDKITIRYVDKYEFYNPQTLEIYPDDVDLESVTMWAKRAKTYRDVEYTVAALVSVPYPLSYRYFGSDEFILNDQTFIDDTQTSSVMLYAFNTDKTSNKGTEAFLSDYTENINPQLDYESKATYAANFENFRSMFLLLGGALSFIVGLVGILNFFNTIMTGVMTRKREFAMLQSVGMTGGQLKRMLVYEGLFYALGASVLSLLLTAVLSPFAAPAMGNIFWFFTYHFTSYRTKSVGYTLVPITRVFT